MRRSLVIVTAAGLVFAGCGSGPPKLPSSAAGPANETAAAADMSMRVANFRYELADGVKAEKDKQDAYKLGAASREDAERLAKAFGVSGEVRADEGGWNVGATGEEPAAPNTKNNVSLNLNRNGSFSINGHYPVSSGVACAEPVPPAPDAPADQPVEECAVPSTTTTRPANFPTEAEARTIAERALFAAGVDIEGLQAIVESLDELISVRFQPRVEGRAVDGYEYAVTVNSERGIAYANGFVGDMKSVGTYDLATLQRSVERLNEQHAYPADDDFRTMTGEADAAIAADATEPAPEPEAPAPDPSEPTIVKLTDVRVGLMMTYEDNGGSLWLTPAYVFTTDQDGGGTVLAAAADDKYLPPPTTVPADTKPGVTEPGSVDGGGSGGNSGGSTGSGGSAEPSPPASNCARASEPIAAEVCTSSSSYKAGDTVVFLIYASDPDRAFTDGPCGDGVTAEYGDDQEGDVRCLACSTEVAPGPGKLAAERKHTYSKAGTYTANFTIKSGAECGEPHPNDSTVTLSLPIKVA